MREEKLTELFLVKKKNKTPQIRSFGRGAGASSHRHQFASFSICVAQFGPPSNWNCVSRNAHAFSGDFFSVFSRRFFLTSAFVAVLVCNELRNHSPCRCAQRRQRSSQSKETANMGKIFKKEKKKSESAFKAVALALKTAVSVDAKMIGVVPSTKVFFLKKRVKEENSNNVFFLAGCSLKQINLFGLVGENSGSRHGHGQSKSEQR